MPSAIRVMDIVEEPSDGSAKLFTCFARARDWAKKRSEQVKPKAVGLFTFGVLPRELWVAGVHYLPTQPIRPKDQVFCKRIAKAMEPSRN
jgi:hypothetical protein